MNRFRRIFGMGSGFGVLAITLSLAPAHLVIADTTNPFLGSFQAQLQVTAVTATPTTGSCSATVGTTLFGVGRSVITGESTFNLTYLFSINNTASFTVLQETFPGPVTSNLTPSGSYRFGSVGSTLETGTFASTYTVLDRNSILAVNHLTYTSPVDGTTSCTETDQVTLIRLPAGGS